MSYFVTGGTGFIGHNLISLLLKRRGNIYVLVRKGSLNKLDKLEFASFFANLLWLQSWKS